MRNNPTWPFLIILPILFCISCARREKAGTNPHYFYRDYDIYARKGIGAMHRDSVTLPYFEVYDLSDTTIGVDLHDLNETAAYVVPKGDQVLYCKYTIRNGARYFYTRVLPDRFVEYAYYELDLPEFEPASKEKGMLAVSNIIPTYATVTFRDKDSVLTLLAECFLPTVIRDITLPIFNYEIPQYACYPFKDSLRYNCLYCGIHYADSSGKTHNYFTYRYPDQPLSRNKPGNGLFSLDKRFRYWRNTYGVMKDHFINRR
jgi:hypothetical protein